jgi:hypothetical protein
MHSREAAHQVSIAWLNHHWYVPAKLPECAQVGMVHVSVRKQEGIQCRKLPQSERRLDQALRTQLCQSATDPDPALQGRVGQQPGTAKIH